MQKLDFRKKVDVERSFGRRVERGLGHFPTLIKVLRYIGFCLSRVPLFDYLYDEYHSWHERRTARRTIAIFDRRGWPPGRLRKSLMNVAYPQRQKEGESIGR